MIKKLLGGLLSIIVVAGCAQSLQRSLSRQIDAPQAGETESNESETTVADRHTLSPEVFAGVMGWSEFQSKHAAAAAAAQQTRELNAQTIETSYFDSPEPLEEGWIDELIPPQKALPAEPKPIRQISATAVEPELPVIRLAETRGFVATEISQPDLAMVSADAPSITMRGFIAPPRVQRSSQQTLAQAPTVVPAPKVVQKPSVAAVVRPIAVPRPTAVRTPSVDSAPSVDPELNIDEELTVVQAPAVVPAPTAVRTPTVVPRPTVARTPSVVSAPNDDEELDIDEKPTVVQTPAVVQTPSVVIVPQPSVAVPKQRKSPAKMPAVAQSIYVAPGPYDDSKQPVPPAPAESKPVPQAPANNSYPPATDMVPPAPSDSSPAPVGPNDSTPPAAVAAVPCQPQCIEQCQSPCACNAEGTCFPVGSGLRCGIACGPCGHCQDLDWDDMQLIPWESLGQGEYIGPARLPHVPEYRLRVDDVIDFVYRLTQKKSLQPYKINVGDTLRIESLIAENLQRDLIVQPDGTITIRQLGQVPAAGRTIDELRADLDERLSRFVKNPTVTVTPIIMNSQLQELRATVDARAGAGGQSRQAKVTPEGTIQLPAIGSVPAQGLTLNELKIEVEQRYNEIVSGLEITPILAQRAPRFIYVTGEVLQPGRYTLEAPTTLIQALALAGNWNVGADLSNIVILRRDENWNLMATKVDMHRALFGKEPCPEGEIWLRDSDIVLLPKSPILWTDNLIELIFTRGLYGVVPITFNALPGTLSKL